jgi:hypothetical protein
MRRFAAAVAAIGSLAAVPDAAGAQVPNGDSVVGQATDCDQGIPPEFCFLFSTSVTLDARSGPAGDAATGTVASTVTISRNQSGIRGTVTCLAVSGNVAVVGFTGTYFPFSPPPVPAAGRIRVTDGGGPASGADTFALSFTSGFPPPTAPDCTAPFPPGGTFYVNDQGDLIVTDSPALPTSKDQCKNGGWQSYGVFKNQGDCVSFVATGGKNPPGKKPG